MPIYADTMVTSKLGVNHVRTAVESAKCIFHKIEQENDLGIDGFVELIKDGKPQNKQIAVQIKSGESFFIHQSNQCIIPVDKHYDYWLNHTLSVYGIVYIPSLGTANWVDIKKYLKKYGNCGRIKFDRTKTNIFDLENFTKIFMPTILGELPQLSFDEAANLFHSDHPSENYLGLVVLFRNSPNELKIWEWFFAYFNAKEKSEIHPILIYYLAHIPWHPDILYRGEEIRQETKKNVSDYFEKFRKREVVKLLSFIDEENLISRGSIGQSVQSIISSLTNRDQLLLEVIKDISLPLFIRECSALIFAYHNGKKALPLLEKLADEGSWYAGDLIDLLSAYGFVDLYN